MVHRFAVATAVLLAAGAAQANSSIKSFVVFGDSFVDAGNANISTGGLTAQASLGYYEGRYSDGPTYIDVLSRARFGFETKASLAGGTNFAVGGARAAVPRVIAPFPGIIPDITQQNAAYLATTGGRASASALYVISFGNNDVSGLAGVPLPVPGSSPPATIPTRTDYIARFTGNITSTITTLSGLGARNFLIFGVPDPRLPDSFVLQTALNNALGTLTLPSGTNLYNYSALNFFARLQQDPTQFGLPRNLNTTGACIPGQLAFGFPPDCSNFLSFDGIHVTKQVQFAIARDIAAQTGIAVVPEPETWAMMILGFGVVGAAMRRRRAVRPASFRRAA